MKVTAKLRKVKSREKITGVIYMRVFEKNNIDLRMATNINIDPQYWDSKRQCIVETAPDSEIPISLQKAINEKISSAIITIKENLPEKGADNEWLKKQLKALELRGEQNIFQIDQVTFEVSG